MDIIEENVRKLAINDKDFVLLTNVTDDNNKAMLSDQRLANNEKIKGRFSLIINKTLPMQKQIEKFANEPVAFYLHKNRNFIEKLQNKSRKNNFDESVRRIEKDVEAINKKGLQDLWCIFNNIDPSNLSYH